MPVDHPTCGRPSEPIRGLSRSTQWLRQPCLPTSPPFAFLSHDVSHVKTVTHSRCFTYRNSALKKISVGAAPQMGRRYLYNEARSPGPNQPGVIATARDRRRSDGTPAAIAAEFGELGREGALRAGCVDQRAPAPTRLGRLGLSRLDPCLGLSRRPFALPVTILLSFATSKLAGVQTSSASSAPS